MQEIDYNGNTGVQLGADAEEEYAKHEKRQKEKFRTSAHEATPTGQDAEADQG